MPSLTKVETENHETARQEVLNYFILRECLGVILRGQVRTRPVKCASTREGRSITGLLFLRAICSGQLDSGSKLPGVTDFSPQNHIPSRCFPRRFDRYTLLRQVLGRPRLPGARTSSDLLRVPPARRGCDSCPALHRVTERVIDRHFSFPSRTVLVRLRRRSGALLPGATPDCEAFIRRLRALRRRHLHSQR